MTTEQVIFTEAAPIADGWRREELALPTRGGAISYLLNDRAGPQAPLVLFSHANGFHGATYKAAFAEIARQYRVMLLDLRGHGASRLPADPDLLRSWHFYADDVDAVLDELGEDRVILAGHSLGAVTSFIVGQKRPHQVQRLVMFEPVLMHQIVSRVLHWGRPFKLMHRVAPLVRYAQQRKTAFDSRDAAFNNYRGRGVFKTWPDPVLQDYVTHGFRDRDDGRVELACRREWEVATYQAQDNNIWKWAHRAQFPITVLKSERGSTMLPVMVARLKKKLPHALIETVPGTTHSLPMEAPDAVARAILAP